MIVERFIINGTFDITTLDNFQSFEFLNFCANNYYHMIDSASFPSLSLSSRKPPLMRCQLDEMCWCQCRLDYFFKLNSENGYAAHFSTSVHRVCVVFQVVASAIFAVDFPKKPNYIVNAWHFGWLLPHHICINASHFTVSQSKLKTAQHFNCHCFHAELTEPKEMERQNRDSNNKKRIQNAHEMIGCSNVIANRKALEMSVNVATLENFCFWIPKTSVRCKVRDEKTIREVDLSLEFCS